MLLIPVASVSALTAGEIQGLGEAVSGDNNGGAVPLRDLNCFIEATNKLVGTSQNEVTYKLKYSANYSKLNAAYSVQAASPNNFLHQKAGAFSLVKGTNYVPVGLANASEKKFTYAILENTSVTLEAVVDGKNCKSKILQTIKPASAQINPSLGGTGTGVNTNLNGTVPSNTQPALNAPLAEIVVPEKHTCQILAEAAKLDKDTLQIGAGIKFENLKIGKFNYSVRGYLSTAPSQVKEYTGVYTNVTAGATGNVLNNGKGFLFTFDSKTSADKYVVAATIGNIDCKLVSFASPIVVPVQINPVVGENVLQPNGAVVNNPPAGNNQPSGAQVNDNPAVLGNGGAGSGSVAGQAGGSSVAPAEGLDAAGQAEAASLDLIAQAGDEDDASTTAVSDDEEINEDMELDEASEPDYILYALLGAIFLSIVAAIILKTKGMM